MKILWICFVWPEPASSAAGYRTLQLINAFKEAGSEVRVCSPCKSNQYQDQLLTKGFVAEHLPANDARFDSYILEYQPDVVFFDRFMIEEQFSWRVREQCPNAMRVLDSIDLHSLRRARQRKVESGLLVQDLISTDFYSEDAIREISAIYRSDLCLLVSDFEQKLLMDIYSVPAELLTLCRFSYPQPQQLKAYDERKDFVVIGNFNHPPNLDSFKLLHEILWQKIKAKLESVGANSVELHIYGAYPKGEIMGLDNKLTGFRVKGWAEDARETLSRYRINLAPLRFGAGIKGKISDGWSVGTPCAATSIAAEGMSEDLEFAGVLADEWDVFADKAVSLYTKRLLWERAQAQAASLIECLFSRGRNEESLQQKIMTIFSNLDELRNRNFVGKMLWYHQYRSTEFFSRWIEEKNKT
jgi:hypothetical protein